MHQSRSLLCVLLGLLLTACVSPRQASFDLLEITIVELQAEILSGRSSCQDIVAAYIQRIEAYDKSSNLNAITEVNPNAILYAARIDESIENEEPLPELFCAPLLIKDNFDTFEMVTTGGSIALRNSIPPDDAFMIRKLRDAGAIILAKTNMAEWAFSPRETVSSSYGRTANAYDLNHVPAGSSGGTASAVAANFGVAGMGSDTGNSIRGPSSHLALFGIRSTLGLTSRDGVIPLAFDRDIAGPMARTVEDGVRLFNVIAGFDPNDPLTVPGVREDDYRDFLDSNGLEGKRIGVFRSLVDREDADPQIKKAFFNAVKDLEAGGAVIVDPFVIDQFEELIDATPFCGRFRYDVGQYFMTLDNPPLVDVNDVLETGELADETINAFNFYAEFPLDVAPDNWDPPCLTWPKQPERNKLQAKVISAMDAAGVDAFVFPTWSNPPAHIDSANEEYRGDNSQGLVPAAGLPALTVPMGYWQDRLPVGLQIAGRPYTEGVLIAIAYAYEQRTQHRRPPPGFGSLGD